jgi:hypothetical protein
MSASSFYPSDLLDEYKSLWTRAESTLCTISINKYRCRIPGFGGTVDPELVKDGFLQIEGGQILNEAGGAYAFVDVFTGKGSPNSIVTVIQAVYEYRLAFVKRFSGQPGVLGDCAAILKNNEGNPQKMLQEFCDAYLGLDCNGFVGNYVARAKRSNMTNLVSFGPQTDIATFLRVGKIRKSIDAMDDLDVLIFPNNVHIAIIDSFEDESHVNVVQSTGGGPQISRHGLVSAGDNKFTLMPPTKVAGPVQIVTYGL